jgi:hypothetical protein
VRATNWSAGVRARPFALWPPAVHVDDSGRVRLSLFDGAEGRALRVLRVVMTPAEARELALRLVQRADAAKLPPCDCGRTEGPICARPPHNGCARR